MKARQFVLNYGKGALILSVLLSYKFGRTVQLKITGREEHNCREGYCKYSDTSANEDNSFRNHIS